MGARGQQAAVQLKPAAEHSACGASGVCSRRHDAGKPGAFWRRQRAMGWLKRGRAAPRFGQPRPPPCPWQACAVHTRSRCIGIVPAQRLGFAHNAGGAGRAGGRILPRARAGEATEGELVDRFDQTDLRLKAMAMLRRVDSFIYHRLSAPTGRMPRRGRHGCSQRTREQLHWPM